MVVVLNLADVVGNSLSLEYHKGPPMYHIHFSSILRGEYSVSDSLIGCSFEVYEYMRSRWRLMALNGINRLGHSFGSNGREYAVCPMPISANLILLRGRARMMKTRHEP